MSRWFLWLHAGILEVLHCILTESPEALNLIAEGHIKSIISLLDKHGRNHKVGIRRKNPNGGGLDLAFSYPLLHNWCVTESMWTNLPLLALIWGGKNWGKRRLRKTLPCLGAHSKPDCHTGSFMFSLSVSTGFQSPSHCLQPWPPSRWRETLS